MAKKAIEVRECDRCGVAPANTWFITGPGVAPREIELCDQHGAPVANAYALGRPATATAPKTGGRTRSAAQSRVAGSRDTRARAVESPPAPPSTPQPAPPSAPQPLGLPVPPSVPEPVWR